MSDSAEARALRLMGLSPESHVVVGNPSFSRWQAANGKWLESVKVQVAERATDVDLDGLVRVLRKRPAKAAPKAEGSGRAFLFAMSDYQLGKAESGPGAEFTVALHAAAVEDAVTRVKLLRKQQPLDTLILADVGDMAEGTAGCYSKQLFSITLDARQQATLAREMWALAIKRLAPLFEDVRMVAIPSNHGEGRQGGKAVTQTSDDTGLANAEQVFEALTLAGTYPQVTLCVPEGNEPWVVLDDLGVAFFHGHTSATKNMDTWWASQCLGGQPVGQAHTLITGHYHFLRLSESSGRTWVQCPAGEAGSEWFRDRTGADSPAGVLSLVVTGSGVDDLKVLGRRP